MLQPFLLPAVELDGPVRRLLRGQKVAQSKFAADLLRVGNEQLLSLLCAAGDLLLLWPPHELHFGGGLLRHHSQLHHLLQQGHDRHDLLQRVAVPLRVVVGLGLALQALGLGLHGVLPVLLHLDQLLEVSLSHLPQAVSEVNCREVALQGDYSASSSRRHALEPVGTTVSLELLHHLNGVTLPERSPSRPLGVFLARRQCLRRGLCSQCLHLCQHFLHILIARLCLRYLPQLRGSLAVPREFHERLGLSKFRLRMPRVFAEHRLSVVESVLPELALQVRLSPV
mmetsp:Transcript_116547/g.341046  ORF Transcript_116547/g.341046 Transcript_116547/m.341046 type:complete len:283 (-) Transcript_116547:1073-1921(-)